MSTDHFTVDSYRPYIVFPSQHYLDVDSFNEIFSDLSSSSALSSSTLEYHRGVFDVKLREEIDRVALFIKSHLSNCSSDLAYVIDGWDNLDEKDRRNIFKEKIVKRTLRAIYVRTNKLKSFFKLNCYLITKSAKKLYTLLEENNSRYDGPINRDTFPLWQSSPSYKLFETDFCILQSTIKTTQEKCVEFSKKISNETYPHLPTGNLKYGSRSEIDSNGSKILLGAKLGYFIGVLAVIISQSTITESNRFKLWKSYGLFIFSVVGGLAVFDITWALNIRLWTQHKINYFSIFQIPHLEPHTMRVLQESGTVMCVFVSCLFWFFETGRKGGQVKNHYASVSCPLILMVFVAIRYTKIFIKSQLDTSPHKDSLTVFNTSVLFRCLVAPFAVVSFRDVYAADVLTSFNKVISDFVYACCWVFTGAFLKDENDLVDGDDEVMCSPTNMANVSTVVISFVLWIRIAQCARKYRDTGATPNLFNILKYGLALAVAVAGRFVEQLEPWYMTLVVVATLYKWFWDVVMDWGLCDKANFSRPPYFLRPKLMLKDPMIYYVVIFLDLILRFLWITSLIPANLQDDLFGNYLSIQLGYLEILRRAMWGIFRVEWEHLVHEDKNEFGFKGSSQSMSQHSYLSNDKPHLSLLLADDEKDNAGSNNLEEYRNTLENMYYSDDEQQELLDD